KDVVRVVGVVARLPGSEISREACDSGERGDLELGCEACREAELRRVETRSDIRLRLFEAVKCVAQIEHFVGAQNPYVIEADVLRDAEMIVAGQDVIEAERIALDLGQMIPAHS